MKKIIALCMTGLILLGVAGCQNENGKTEPETTKPVLMDFNLQKTPGSDLDDTVLPQTFQKMGATNYTLSMLQNAFIQSFTCDEGMSLQTHKDYPALANTESELIDKIKTGEMEIAFVEKAKDDLSFDSDLEYTLIGRESFLILTSDQNPVKSITSEQLKNVLDGKITNWNQLGGNDGKILLLGENGYFKGSSALSKLFLNGGIVPKSNLSDDEYKKLFPDGVNSPLALKADYCMTSDYVLDFMPYYSLALNWSIDNSHYLELHQITVDDNKVTSESIQNETTPYLLKTYAVTKKSNVSESVQKFLSWLIEENGTGISEDARLGNGIGALPSDLLCNYLPKDKF